MRTESFRRTSSQHWIATLAGAFVALVFGLFVASFGAKFVPVFALSGLSSALLLRAVNQDKLRTLAWPLLAIAWGATFLLLGHAKAAPALPALVATLLGVGYGSSFAVTRLHDASAKRDVAAGRILLQLTIAAFSIAIGYLAAIFEIGLDLMLLPTAMAVTSVLLLFGAYRLRSRGWMFILLGSISGVAGLAIAGSTILGVEGAIKWVAYALGGGALAGLAWWHATKL